MIKTMIFLKRRDGLTREEFARWWLERHRPLAERLPGLRKHAYNLLADGPFDAVVEQWFEDEVAMRSSYDTKEGRAVVADSQLHVSVRHRVVADEYVFEV